MTITLPALSSPIMNSRLCGVCNGNGCGYCDSGEITAISETASVVNDTPAGVCECGGLLWDTWRYFLLKDGRKAGLSRYVECDKCEWRQAK